MDAIPPRYSHDSPDVPLQLCELQLLVLVFVHPIKIQKIWAKDHNQGLRDLEANIIRLVGNTVTGSEMEINQIRLTFY